MNPRAVRIHVAALAAFVALAIAVSWPLPLHLSTHLMGSPSGDTGVYVWNLWVFRHEVIEHHQWPFVTHKIFPLTDGIDLSQHNYTPLADIVAFPLLPWLGTVATFNVLSLAQLALAGYGLCLLSFEVTRRPVESWLAGALFLASPVVTARSTAHFSLLGAAPLPLFTLFLMRYLDAQRTRHAVAAGLMMAWAQLSDAYYGTYCLLIGLLVFLARFVRVRLAPTGPGVQQSRVLVRTLDVVLLGLGAVIAALALTGGASVDIWGVPVHLRTPYTPVLAFIAVLAARLVLMQRPRLECVESGVWPVALRFGVVAGLIAALPFAPVLYALGQRLSEGRFVSPPIFWRSSPRGVDLLAFFLPNPNHPWFGGPFRDWLAGQRQDGFPGLTASVSLVALLVVVVGLWQRRDRLPRFWLGFTILFASLALGPFVRVGGVNTFIPAPWAFLRYVPVIGLARSPSRFVIPATLGFAILFAVSLSQLRAGQPRRRRVLTILLSLALAVELLPLPRTLYAASAPAIYDVIATDPDHTLRVLELPVGVRDGTSSIGNFSARTQFYQTFHGKAVLGGYVSRVSRRRKMRNLEMPVMNALLTLSEGAPLDPGRRRRALDARERFLDQARIGYVVIDSARASSALRSFAVEFLDLVRVDSSGGLELYRPRRAPPPLPPTR